MKSSIIKPMIGTASLLLLGLSAGCKSIATQEKTEMKVSAAIELEHSLALEKWSMPADPRSVEVDWLKRFNDPTLTQLVEEAQRNNRELQAAAANVERARALALQAGASLAPNLGLVTDGAGSGQLNGSRTNQLGLRLVVNWELDVWGRIGAGQRAAQASAEAAAVDYLYSQHSIAATTAKAYFIAIEVNERIRIIKASLDALQEINDLVHVKFDNGVASAQDRALANADLANAREQLIHIKGTQRDTARALELLLGRYPSAELKIKKTLPHAPTLPPAGLPAQVLERRPDVISAERQLAAAFNLSAAAKAARLPSISLTGSFGAASNALNTLLNPANLAWRAGAMLSAPFSDGGARAAAVAVATADQKKALARYAAVTLNALSEVEQNLDQAEVLAARESQLSIAYEQSVEAYRIANVLYRAGETELLDALTIQQRAFSAESSLLSLKRQLLEHRVNLNLALGGDW